MKKKILFVTISLILIGINKNYSQSIAKPAQKQGAFSRLIHNDKVALKLDYFGEFVLHPGAAIGIDYTLSEKKWVTIHWDSDLGGFWHRWNNTSLFLKTSIGGRFRIASFFVDLNLGAGYMHSFAAGIIYQKSSDGGLERASNVGHPHFMPTSSLLLGWDGTKKMKLPWTFHLGVEGYLQSSFNHSFLPHLAAKLGFTYKFKNK
jgi:hypothetical protein